MKFLLLIFLSIGLKGCIHSEKVFDNIVGGYEIEHKQDSILLVYPYRLIKDKQEQALFLYEYYYMSRLYTAFNERSLSEKSRKLPIYRITVTAWRGHPYIISITPEYISLKEGSQDGWVNVDKKILAEDWRYAIGFLEKGNKVTGTGYTAGEYKVIDSLLKFHPHWKETEIYEFLLDKAIVNTGNNEFACNSTVKINSARAFNRLTQSLIKAGYWQTSLQDPCEYIDTDGISFVLEANIGGKYNYVRLLNCSDKPASALREVCAEIIEQVGLAGKISLIDK
jgi:hypothetical protein